jgi:hypothetical protein
MVQAMVLSSFLVACVALLFAAVVLKRLRLPEAPDGVRLPEPEPIVPLPAPAAPAHEPPAVPAAVLPAVLPVRAAGVPASLPRVAPVAARVGRNNGFARFTPIEGSRSAAARR